MFNVKIQVLLISPKNMSASLQANFPVKKEIHSIIFANIIFITVLFIVIISTFGTFLKFDLVGNVLPATKYYCLVISLFHVLHGFLLSSSERGCTNKFKVSTIVVAAALLSLSAVCYHVIAVLFGAPFFQSSTETFHFAMMMTSCTTVPAFMCLGSNSESWIRVFLLHSPEVGRESIVHLTVILSIVGAWIGAAPIPLDWDRPWQVWPITCVVGCIIGHNMGLLFASAHLYYKYLESRKFKIT